MLEILIRAFPFAFTIIIANFLHYKTLIAATAQARKPRREGGQGRLLLSFDLTGSLPMRRVRYWVKMFRYSFLLAFIALAFPVLPELHGFWGFSWLTPVTISAGVVSAVLAIALHENTGERMRTTWNPAKDFRSVAAGTFFDCLRLAGSTFLVPLEEELLFRSMVYRLVISARCPNLRSFADVPFATWSWEAAAFTNLVFGWFHGGEWRSASVSGLLFQLLASVDNNFSCALAAHGTANLVIGCWVLSTGQREYW